MDVSFINAFICAANDTFTTMLQIKLTVGEPALKQKVKYTSEITGSIGFSGKAQGFIAFSYTKDMAINIVSKLIGTQLHDLGMDVVDGIGEITNIVAGNAKQYLPDLALSISLPNIIIGSEYKIFGVSQIPVIVVPLQCELGKCIMEVALRTL